MQYDKDRLQQVCNQVAEHSIDYAAKVFGVKSSSIERYLREANSLSITPTIKGGSLPRQTEPRILIYDVENSPTIAGVWGMWNQNINKEAVVSEWFMLSWSAKWLLDTEIHSDVLTSEEALAGDDKRIMHSLWSLLDQADIVVGHNLVKFDNKKVNTRFIVNGISPVSPFRSIDTLSIARKHFSFSSNRLDYLCKQLDLDRKADNGGMDRWMRCIKGDPKALLEMEKYNRQDINISEELYMALRPFMTTGHPNLGLFFESDVDLCRTCGSSDIAWLEGKYHYTGVNKYPVYQCNKCHGYGRSRFSSMTADERKHVTASVTR